MTKKEIRHKIKYLKSLSYKEVIKEIKTPRDAKFYLEHCLLWRLRKGTVRSFRFIHKSGRARCLGYSIAAAALMSGTYPPLLLHIFFKDEIETHVCYVYKNKKTGKWGCLGIPGENSQGAIFKDLFAVCRFIEKNQRRMFPGIKCEGYTLHDFSGRNIIDSPKKINVSRFNHIPEWNMNGKKTFIN